MARGSDTAPAAFRPVRDWQVQITDPVGLQQLLDGAKV
jgi:hypothetical protein